MVNGLEIAVRSKEDSRPPNEWEKQLRLEKKPGVGGV